jgi:hypothetical protein
VAAISRSAALLSESVANAARAIQIVLGAIAPQSLRQQGPFSCTIPHGQRSYSAALLVLGSVGNILSSASTF